MTTAATEKAATAKAAPTAEAIQEALTFLRAFAERKTSANDSENPDGNALDNSDIFKTIEIALKSFQEAKAASARNRPEEHGKTTGGKMHAYASEQTVDSEDEYDEYEDYDEYEEEEDDDEEGDDPFAGSYYWNPGPEWKTIGLVAGGAALVGLGALLYKMFDD